MRQVTMVGNRTLSDQEATAVRLELSRVFRERQESSRLQRKVARLKDAPERSSVSRAMLAVEERLVEAFWVLGRSTQNPGPRRQAKHGVDYMLDREDKWGAAVAGGGWLTQSPPAPPATSQEVDRSDEALEWLQLLEEDHRNIISAGARSKQGDASRRVNWFRVRAQHPKFSALSADRLGRMYREGLRLLAFQVKTDHA